MPHLEKFMDSRLEERLAALPSLSKSSLRELWKQLFKNQLPIKMRKELILRVVAYRLQEQEVGGLKDAQRRSLHELSRVLEVNPKAAISSRPSIKPGTRLIREWKKQVHVVEIDEKGYQYKGSRYESLSEIARLITGTRWSGPLFFGLKSQPPKESKEVQ
jgi:Protein of unknown function (DUF2924)